MNRLPRLFCLLLIALSAISIAPAMAKNIGAAVLKVMPQTDLVQKSNYRKNSFQLLNVGNKDIVEVKIDVTSALFPDSVFDPEGLAGDSVAKPLQIDQDMKTGVVLPEKAKQETYLGEGGDKGYRTLRLTFDPNNNSGFNPSEELGFSIDMDPNSIAGTEKKPIDEAGSPKWDAGGISGAELIGSSFVVTFSDNTKARGQLFSTATQAGSQGIATQAPNSLEATLSVNGMTAGEVGTYSSAGPKIIVSGPAGKTVRVVVAKGFIQPVVAYKETLHQQLAALSAMPFPANNAVEFQFFDFVLTSKPTDISSQFDFSGVKLYDFSASPDKPFSVDEDKVSLAIVAAVIDPQKNLAMGQVTAPIYLTYK